MKLSEIIYNIQNLIAKGRQSQSNPVSDRQCIFILNYYYAKLIEQQLEKQGNNESIYQQDLGNQKVEKVDRSIIESNITCNIVSNTFKTSCIYRSVNKFPQPIFAKGVIAINYLGTIDLLNSFSYHSLNKIIKTSKYKYTANLPKYFILDDYRYIVTPSFNNLQYIREIGIYSDPIQAYKMNNYLDSMNMNYPISGKMLDTIYKLMLETEFNVLIKAAGDNTNNNSDESLK